MPIFRYNLKELHPQGLTIFTECFAVSSQLVSFNEEAKLRAIVQDSSEALLSEVSYRWLKSRKPRLSDGWEATAAHTFDNGDLLVCHKASQSLNFTSCWLYDKKGALVYSFSLNLKDKQPASCSDLNKANVLKQQNLIEESSKIPIVLTGYVTYNAETGQYLLEGNEAKFPLEDAPMSCQFTGAIQFEENSLSATLQALKNASADR